LIAANTDKKLKSVFKGKSSYIIWLEEPDKKAIKTAYDLARALKVKDASGKAIAVLEKKVKSVENKYDSQKEWLFRNRNSHSLILLQSILNKQLAICHWQLAPKLSFQLPVASRLIAHNS